MHIQPNFRVNQANETHAGLSDLLTAMQPAVVTFYPTDAVIYAQGDAAGPLYLVEFGTVRICRMTADGRRLVSAFHMAGEVFGFEADGVHGSYAESVDGAGIRVLRPSSGEQPTGSILTLALPREGDPPRDRWPRTPAPRTVVSVTPIPHGAALIARGIF